MNNDVFVSEIGDAELLAYLDGAADADVAAKIEGSEVYLRRSKELARMNKRLTAQLYRHTCPDSLELGEYHLGMLMQEKARAIEAHLAECPHCARELAQLSEYMAAERPDSEPNLTTRLKNKAAGLLPDLDIRRNLDDVIKDSGDMAIIGEIARTKARGFKCSPDPHPYIFLVGGGKDNNLVYDEDDIKIYIHVMNDIGNPGKMVLSGGVIGVDAVGWEVRLISSGKQVAATEVEEVDLVENLGFFRFSCLFPAIYDIVIADNGVKFKIHDIEI